MLPDLFRDFERVLDLTEDLRLSDHERVERRRHTKEMSDRFAPECVFKLRRDSRRAVAPSEIVERRSALRVRRR